MIVDLILIAAVSLRDAEDRRVYRWLEPAPACHLPGRGGTRHTLEALRLKNPGSSS